MAKHEISGCESLRIFVGDSQPFSAAGLERPVSDPAARPAFDCRYAANIGPYVGWLFASRFDS
jgi:hypothetical protein